MTFVDDFFDFVETKHSFVSTKSKKSSTIVINEIIKETQYLLHRSTIIGIKVIVF